MTIADEGANRVNPTTTMAEHSDNFILHMHGISKSFSAVPVLKGVKLEVEEGKVHVLMGENGAGKSTLMKILAGIYQKDQGTIYLSGKPVEIRTPREALTLGISMIHQELNPVREMRVSENIFLGREPCYRVAGVVNRKRERVETQRLFSEMDLAIDPEAEMKSLSIAEMQMVEIAKAVSYESRIIIMDEPTSAITGREVLKLFEIIDRLKADGVAIIYISHKMDEVFQIANTITVMRDGEHIETRPAKDFDQDTLISLMVGRRISELFPKVNSKKGEVTLEVEALSRSGEFRNVSFRVREGEILGFSGLMGAGRSEVMETIFGIRRADSGDIKVKGKSIRIKSPIEAIRNGIALVTEDRQLKGLNLRGSVRDNITIVGLKSLSRFGQLLRRDTENRTVDASIQKLEIKVRNRNQYVDTLSGGNQQKVVLAKWLVEEPEIIILDEPTRGIDIGAKAEIYKLISKLAEEGKTIIMVSSELPEILGLCDGVIVMYHGEITGKFDRRHFDSELIMKAAMGSGNGASGEMRN